MGDLIQFLIPLAILGGVILNVLGKLRNQDGEKQDPRRTQPPIRNWQEKNQSEPQYAENQSPGSPELPNQEIADRYQQAKEKLKESKEVLRDSGGIPGQNRSALRTKKPNNQVHVKPEINISNLSAKQLAEQVVWTEILGPPRAKQPHRAFQQRKKIK